jgi:CRP-like cAMP-binding protein
MFTQEQQARIDESGERRRMLRNRLALLGDRRRELRAAHAEVSAELRRLLPQAAAVHLRVSDLARWTGMTRKAVYDILAATPPDHKTAPAR